MTERRAVHDAWPEATMRRRAGELPDEVEVLRPSSVGEVRAAVRTGRRVVPLGGGSGVCGAIAPEPDDLVLDLGGLRAIEIDEVDLVCRAQAGVRGLELERRLQERGLTLGHFPASLPVATVGGMVSTRSCGQESTRHGAIEDLVMGLEVVLPDGRLLEADAQPRSGLPALPQLFVGAEGGLGVIVSAALRVRRLPERVVGRGWRLPDVRRGLEAMREIVQRDLRPLVLRLYDPEDTLLQGQGEGCLLIAAAAGSAGVAEAEAAVIGRILSGLGAEDLGGEPWDRWLAGRFDLSLERLQHMLEPEGSFVDTIEVAARWSRLEDVHRAIKAHLSGVGLALCHFGHPYGQGACAYFTLAGSADDDGAALAAHARAWEGTMAIALERGAAISHHHGVGRARARWVEAGLGGWADVWRLIRHALDPQDRMNPGALGGPAVKDVLIIVNPASGGGRTGRGWPQIAERLRQEGLVFDSALTERAGEATELAREAVREGRPVVVAAGGDGTIHEVAGGFFADGEPSPGESAMGILPLGTGGDFRRTLGVPKDPGAAARILLEGRRRAIDVGRCRYRAGEGDRVEVFINIASCGLGGEVVRRVNGGMRLPTGELTFTLAIAVSLLRWRNRRLRLTVDGTEREVVAQQVAVANCRYYGAGLQIAPEAAPDDGLFDVVTVGDVSLVENLGLLRPLRQGTHLGMAKISCHRGSRVEVVAVGDGPVRLDLDGEQPGILPALFEILPRALPMVAP